MPKNNYSITWLPIERERNLLGLSHCPGKIFTSHMGQSNIKKDGEFIKSNRVELIVSLLTDGEIKSLGIKNFESIWTKLNIKNIKFPIRDLSSPPTDQLRTFKELIKIILSFIHKSVVMIFFFSDFYCYWFQKSKNLKRPMHSFYV